MTAIAQRMTPSLDLGKIVKTAITIGAIFVGAFALGTLASNAMNNSAGATSAPVHECSVGCSCSACKP
jgi:hypothetical protein